MSGKSDLTRAGAIKGLGDAPGLRASGARQCVYCMHFQQVEGDWGTGQCAKHDFATNDYWVCDTWEEKPAAPLPVVVLAETEGNEDETAMLSIPRYVKSLHLPYDEQYLRDVLAVKFIGRDDLRGYAVLWGSEDRVDLEAEFFTPQTDFWKSALGFPRPLSWNHAQDRAAFRSHPVVGKLVELGEDQVGMFYHAVLDRAHAYRQAVEGLIGQRVVGTSSDSAPQYVERVKTKKGATWLKTWPLFAAALTDVPCEPRMIEQGNVYWKSITDFLKRAGVNWQDLPQSSAEATAAAAREWEQRLADAQRHQQLLNLYTEG